MMVNTSSITELRRGMAENESLFPKVAPSDISESTVFDQWPLRAYA